MQSFGENFFSFRMWKLHRLTMNMLPRIFLKLQKNPQRSIVPYDKKLLCIWSVHLLITFEL
jgi:hypothetical protein